MKAGFFLIGDYNWAGGIYYVANLLHTLNAVAPNNHHSFTLFHTSSVPDEILKDLNYPNAHFVNLDKANTLTKALNKTSVLLRGRGFRIAAAVQKKNPDFIFPLLNFEEELHTAGPQPVYWLYDFQHKFLPELFTAEEIKRRDDNFGKIAGAARHIVVSSHDSASHFRQFFPDSKAAVHVFQFASHILKQKLPPAGSVQKKLNTGDNYFIVSNQFWKHKNHLTVLKAMALLIKEQKQNFRMVFTGKQNTEDPYFLQLKTFAEEHKINEYLVFTGFIAREEQAALMRDALAVIQPSHFEGWSTVVEDAKALNKRVLLSDIAVHREQMKKNVSFFEKNNEQALAGLMAQVLNGQLKNEVCDYQQNIAVAAEQFMNMVNQLK